VRSTFLALAFALPSVAASADEIDFAKYLQHDYSAAALATALAMLGSCDTPVRWSESAEEVALFVSCTDIVDGEEFDHGVRIDFVPDGSFMPMTFTAVP
jgi:hypothetical protein